MSGFYVTRMVHGRTPDDAREEAIRTLAAERRFAMLAKASFGLAPQLVVEEIEMAANGERSPHTGYAFYTAPHK